MSRGGGGGGGGGGSSAASKAHPSNTTGSRGEKVAADHLRSQGYKIIARNLKCNLGEVDILAQAPDAKTIVIVEVKTALMPSTKARPEERVNRDKRHKLVALASYFARRYDFTDKPIRFDVIGVTLQGTQSGTPDVRHHAGAFESHV